MLRYGKKLDGRHNDKISRSNRGRTRTSATGSDRTHAILGYRCGHEQRVELRAHKKRLRLLARLGIQEELLDCDLSQADPEIWLHGTDLTSVKDAITQRTQRHRGYPASFVAADPYAYVPDALDWEYSAFLDQEDDESTFCHLHAGDYEVDRSHDWSCWDSDPDPDPEPIDAAWRDLWVAGYTHDADGRDLPDPMYDRYDDDDDYLYDLQNPLLERRDPVVSATIEAVVERDIERHRAGERYFKQTGRTVWKPLDAPSRARLQPHDRRRAVAP
jgi:hypothetical protein